MSTSTDIAYIGVDAGGSSTRAVLGTSDGRILAKSTSGPANPLSVGFTKATEHIFKAINKCIKEVSPETVASIYIGMAGGKPKALKRVYEELLQYSQLKKTKNLRVDHDLRIALYNGVQDGNGVVLIAGTGSAALGIDDQGNDVIVSGWHHLIGEAGGYMLGIQALIAATRSVDGRGEKTMLEELVQKHLNLHDYQDLPYLLHNQLTNSSKIGALAPLVDQAALDGDPVAKKIVDELVQELNATIQALSKRVDQEKLHNIVLVGSIFRMKCDTMGKFKETVSAWLPEATFIIPENDPVHAALQLAILNAQK